MPLYEYKCVDCGHEFEELVSFAGANKVKCEKCGGKTERLASCFSSNTSSAGSGSGGHSAPSCGGGG